MKTVFLCATVALAILNVTTSVQAKGCLKGATVGALAGHFAGRHGVLGAAAGCAIGRHEANKRDKEQQRRM
jgi:hypothetical protein